MKHSWAAIARVANAGDTERAEQMIKETIEWHTTRMLVESSEQHSAQIERLRYWRRLLANKETVS